MPDLSKFDLYHLVWNHPKIRPDEMRDLLAWSQQKVNQPDLIQKRVKRDLMDKLRGQIRERRSAGAEPTVGERYVSA